MSERPSGSSGILFVMFGLTLAVALGLPQSLQAQRVMSTGFKMNADSGTAFLAGITSSSSGVDVPFEAITGSNDTIRGYRYNKSALSSLQAGALIPLFIPNLKFTIEFGSGCTDETGEGLSGCNSEPPARGAWKTVKLQSVEVSEDGNSLKLTFAEEAKLRTGSKLQALEFVADGEWFVLKPRPQPKPKKS